MYFGHVTDPVITDPSLYRLVWENDRVRIVEYLDAQGDATHVHIHADSVMVTTGVGSVCRQRVGGDRA
jgi:hypothetical protein